MPSLEVAAIVAIMVVDDVLLYLALDCGRLCLSWCFPWKPLVVVNMVILGLHITSCAFVQLLLHS